MAKENAVLNKNENLNEELSESFDFDELEEKLQSQLGEELADMQFLAEEKEEIGNPDSLGNVIGNVIWEQFINQVAVFAGEDFIKENRGLHLDLSKDAHIQTPENFDKGKIATHNTEIDYQKRHATYRGSFQTDPNINYKRDDYEYDNNQQVWTRHDPRSGSYKIVLKRNARYDFDKGRPMGNNTAKTHMEHVIPAAEIIRDPEANAHLAREEQINFANSEKNLISMDSGANQSKGDSTMREFLDSKREGKKPAERYNINEKELRQKDDEAREGYGKVKKEGKQRSIETGKKSQKEEALRIGGKALRAVIMQLLAELVREIIAKLIKWFMSSKKAIGTLLDSLKKAIRSFIGKLRQNLINAGKALLTTVTTAIIGPIVRTVKKAWIILKQGYRSIKEAVRYIKDPANKGKSVGILMMEVGKIVIAGLAGIGAIALGEVIEKKLMLVPVFAIEIPLLGSLASVLGIFFGAVVAGIIGAIVINLLDKLIAKKKKKEVQIAAIQKGNQIMATQHKIQAINEIRHEINKENIQNNIINRHQEAGLAMKHTYESIMEDFVEDFSGLVIPAVIAEGNIVTNMKIDELSNDLDDMLTDLRKTGKR